MIVLWTGKTIKALFPYQCVWFSTKNPQARPFLLQTSFFTNSALERKQDQLKSGQSGAPCLSMRQLLFQVFPMSVPSVDKCPVKMFTVCLDSHSLI